MVSSKQIEANRKNARKSTGPQSEEGKAASRLNAVRHGVLAKTPVVPNLEKLEDWEVHRDEWVASLQPLGGAEKFLAERVIELSWRLRRVAQYERDEVAQFYADDAPRFWREMEEEGVAGGRQLPELPKLGAITRYEAHLHRSLLQSLHELQRLQARRQDGGGAVPVAIDVIMTESPSPSEHINENYQTNPISRVG